MSRSCAFRACPPRGWHALGQTSRSSRCTQHAFQTPSTSCELLCTSPRCLFGTWCLSWRPWTDTTNTPLTFGSCSWLLSGSPASTWDVCISGNVAWRSSFASAQTCHLTHTRMATHTPAPHANPAPLPSMCAVRSQRRPGLRADAAALVPGRRVLPHVAPAGLRQQPASPGVVHGYAPPPHPAPFPHCTPRVGRQTFPWRIFHCSMMDGRRLRRCRPAAMAGLHL